MVFDVRLPTMHGKLEAEATLLGQLLLLLVIQVSGSWHFKSHSTTIRCYICSQAGKQQLPDAHTH